MAISVVLVESAFGQTEDEEKKHPRGPLLLVSDHLDHLTGNTLPDMRSHDGGGEKREPHT